MSDTSPSAATLAALDFVSACEVVDCTQLAAYSIRATPPPCEHLMPSLICGGHVLGVAIRASLAPVLCTVCGVTARGTTVEGLA